MTDSIEPGPYEWDPVYAQRAIKALRAERDEWRRLFGDAHVRAQKAETALAELQAEMADPFSPRHIAQAVKRANRQRDEAVESAEAERDEYAAELRKRLAGDDEDVLAVAEACAGIVDGTPPQPIRHEYAVRRLRIRFADRIADAERRGVLGAPRTDLERAAEEQGVQPVRSIDRLTAPEDERLSDEEWAAYCAALNIDPVSGESTCSCPHCKPGDRQGSTRDQIERMLTDEGRRKVEEFMAEAAGQSDDIDIDEVIAQNHRDAMRDWGIADE